MGISAELARALRETEELELVTHGRRTGRDHVVRLWFAYEDGVLWLRADEGPPDWLRNLRRHPDCVVRLGDHELAARNEPVEDSDAALRHLVELWRAKYGADWVQPWYVERGRVPVLLRIDRAAGR